MYCLFCWKWGLLTDNLRFQTRNCLPGSYICQFICFVMYALKELPEKWTLVASSQIVCSFCSSISKWWHNLPLWLSQWTTMNLPRNQRQRARKCDGLIISEVQKKWLYLHTTLLVRRITEDYPGFQPHNEK